jgi:hypothetical protein
VSICAASDLHRSVATNRTAGVGSPREAARVVERRSDRILCLETVDPVADHGDPNLMTCVVDRNPASESKVGGS